MKLLSIVFCLILSCHLSLAQKEVIDTDITISNSSTRLIQSKYSKLDNAIYRSTTRMLVNLQKIEAKLQKKLQKVDTTKAKDLFADSQSKYRKLQERLNTSDKLDNSTTEYITGLDSLQTAFNFLHSKDLKKPVYLNPNQLEEIRGISNQLQEVQSRMNQASAVRQFIQDREQQLKDQLAQYGLGKQLVCLNKQVFYYRQQLEEYKNIINDKKKLEQVVLTKLSELPAFQEFMKNNSYVGRLFSLPANFSDPASLTGLQTRGQVTQMIAQRIGSSITAFGSSDPAQYFQPQIDQAQGQLTSLKSKINQYGGSSSSIEQPDFKPNGQKTKTFMKRITYGFNIQNQKQTNLIPSISNIAFTMGYRLTDKSVVGVGGNYLLGLGNGINHIKLTNQGAGMRSFIDIKAKGSFWLSGGFEMNYMQSFVKFCDLQNVSVWQKSALVGISKKYKISKSKESNMQLLYDALYNQHVPHSQPLIFRLGYSIN